MNLETAKKLKRNIIKNSNQEFIANIMKNDRICDNFNEEIYNSKLTIKATHVSTDVELWIREYNKERADIYILLPNGEVFHEAFDRKDFYSEYAYGSGIITKSIKLFKDMYIENNFVKASILKRFDTIEDVVIDAMFTIFREEV